MSRHGYQLRVEPRLGGEDLPSFRDAVGLTGSDDETERARGLEVLKGLAANAQEPASRAWLGYRLALAREEDGDLPGAAEALDEAAGVPGLPPLAEALLRSRRWRVLTDQRLPAEALEQAVRGSAALENVDRDWPVLAALVRAERAASLRSVGRLGESEEAFGEALSVLEALAAGSVELAWTLRHAANTAWLADDHDLAEQRVRQARDLREGLGLETRYEQGFLGLLAAQAGRSAEAEALYLAAMEGADERSRAVRRGNLARLYLDRGELERARSLLEDLVGWYRAEQDPKNTFPYAAALGNLAEAERRLGDLETAEEHARASLALFEERVPGSISTADALINLGELLGQQGRLEAAEDVLTRGLAVASEARPEGVPVADAHAALGAVAFRRGDLDAAERRYRRALALQQRFFVRTWRQAEWLHALGRIEAARGRQDAALELGLDAVEVLEGLRGRLGGAHEASAGFASLYHQIYWAPLDRLAETGRAAEAFALSERYRAQTLLALLARRELDFSADLPEAIERERRRLARRYDGVRLRIERAEEGKRKELRVELDRIRLAQQEIEDRIRAISPRLAALHDPQPLDAPRTLALLGERTLLLSYAVGPERSWAFALGPGMLEPEAFEITAGSGELERELESFRRMVGRPGGRHGAVRAAGQALSDRLLAPVADRLRSAHHVVVVPDGPLHLLPWAALPDPAASDEPLIARSSISVAASATVLGELLGRESAAPRELVAFGDPSAHPREQPRVAVQVALRAGTGLGPLPWSREEVEALGAVFGDGAAIYLGDEVTEERLLAVAPAGRRLHLACHAVVDPLLPLESGLVLAPPAQEGATSNGFLQVWEIYQGLRLDAELVTLSACETALGRELTGEGVLGLTRAFHYAGARTVVSSLWKVSDQATALLMESFYRHLLKGQGKAEALRRAQLELLRGGTEAAAGRSHPFYWAAFQVHGAWD
ncbi:MAG TPA: CHAT domain-containing protein [Thermoanaerobaculia bacterium]|nr:CHAT domain-containing protein [Thermoanaerobaculia bacterium]